MAQDPFAILIDIERKCRSQAKAIPHLEALGEVWQGIGFLAGNQHFLSPLSEVKEVLTAPRITPLPSSVPWFLGVSNLRGHVLPITDLAAFLLTGESKTQALTPSARVLVVDFEQGAVGFLVTQVLGVQRFQSKTLKTVIEEKISDEVKAHIQGKFESGTTPWYVLSLKSLSQTGQFYHVVKEAGA